MEQWVLCSQGLRTCPCPQEQQDTDSSTLSFRKGVTSGEWESSSWRPKQWALLVALLPPLESGSTISSRAVVQPGEGHQEMKMTGKYQRRLATCVQVSDPGP